MDYDSIVKLMGGLLSFQFIFRRILFTSAVFQVNSPTCHSVGEQPGDVTSASQNNGTNW